MWYMGIFCSRMFFEHLRRLKDVSRVQRNTFDICGISNDVKHLLHHNDAANDTCITLKRDELKLLLQGACLCDELKYHEPIDKDNIESEQIVALTVADGVRKATSGEASKETAQQSCHESIPEHIKFQVASVDAQHTLWNTPSAENGMQDVKFINERHWSYYFQTLNVNTLYWNYDLKSIVEKTTPKANEQARRSKVKNDQKTMMLTD